VRRPNSSVVCPGTQNDEFSCTLDTTGTTTLVVRDASGSNTGSFSTTLQNLSGPVGCVAIKLRETGKTGTIAKAAEMDCWTRAGSAGDRWRIRLVETSGNLSGMMEVIRPDGTTECPNNGATEITCALDAAGTHTGAGPRHQRHPDR
jgi:hypothetical protein